MYPASQVNIDTNPLCLTRTMPYWVGTENWDLSCDKRSPTYAPAGKFPVSVGSNNISTIHTTLGKYIGIKAHGKWMSTQVMKSG